MAVKILDAGSGPGSVAKGLFTWVGEMEITRMDANPEVIPDVVADIGCDPIPEDMYQAYDIVLASHMLEHIDRDKAFHAVKWLADAVRPGGELWIIVPSLEWACKMILYGHDNAGVQLATFGGQGNAYDYHRCGFTLSALRQIVDIAGMKVRKAYQSPFEIDWYDKHYTCVQNIVIALKPEPEEGTQDGIDPNPV